MLKSEDRSTRLTAPNQIEEFSSNALKTLGENISKERERQGLSREKVAERANTSVDTIKRFEYGKGVRLDIAIQIGEALNVPLRALLPQKEPTPEQILREILLLIQTAIKILTT